MLSIWPEIQPMSRVADFACCAILDFRSPCGNDTDNQGMPSGVSPVAHQATSDLSAKAGLLFGAQYRLQQSGINYRGHCLPGNAGQTGSRNRATSGTGKAFDAGKGTKPSALGRGFGHTGSRPTGNR